MALTTEMCVVLLFVAAAVVALAVRPARTGEAVEHLLEGELRREGDEEPSVDMECLADGTVVLWRNGLRGYGAGGRSALSLKVTVRGFDIDIEERSWHGRESSAPAAEAADTALFRLDFMAPEHYSVRYRTADADALAAAWTFHSVAGARRHVRLS